MKPETEELIKKDIFTKGKRMAVTCLQAMGAEVPEGVDPCSWEGVMSMYEDILAHSKSAAQKAAAGMAVAKWTHHHEECETMKALAEAEKMLESEMATPEEGASAEEPKPAPKVAVSSPKPAVAEK